MSGYSLLLLGLSLSACASLSLQPLGPTAERFIATTGDGWHLSLVRYPAKGPPTGRPVLLCHGISANDRNMDLDDEHSMARWFAARGRETWTMSLRGTGSSDVADPSQGRADYDFDAFWQMDLPATLRVVREASGAAKIDFVGHSMGGLVMYAYLSQGGTGVAAVATMGAPTRLNYGTQTEAFIRTAGEAITAGSKVSTAFPAWLLSPFQDVIDDHRLQRFFYNPANVNARSWGRLMAYGTADIAGGVARQLKNLVDRGAFESADGSIDFRRDMARIEVPTLVIAGRLDRVAPVPAVKDGYRALGGPKEWLLISRANGAQAEYNHMDLVIGDRAPDEVWSSILRFFERHR